LAPEYLREGVFKNSPPGRVSSQLTLRVFQVAAARGDLRVLTKLNWFPTRWWCLVDLRDTGDSKLVSIFYRMITHS
ncbi:hypothetical protein, partial [Cylindrospermopsis raciborskii]|uniref:hypothetical protein n=1 Tax=Cylindrospermopsis raciborskii TaxID=77022 RepID=UPI001B3A91C6